MNHKRKTVLTLFLVSFITASVGLTIPTAGAGCPDDCSAGMVSYWKLDETVAGPVVDCYGSYDGTNNGATINQPGWVEKAYSFDGVDDYVDSGDGIWKDINGCVFVRTPDTPMVCDTDTQQCTVTVTGTGSTADPVTKASTDVTATPEQPHTATQTNDNTTTFDTDTTTVDNGDGTFTDTTTDITTSSNNNKSSTTFDGTTITTQNDDGTQTTTTTTTLPPCTISSASITSQCSGGSSSYCEEDETISMSGIISLWLIWKQEKRSFSSSK